MTNRNNRAERRRYAKVWGMPMAKGTPDNVKRDHWGNVLPTHRMIFKKFTEKRKGVRYLRIQPYVAEI